jgi:tetratricopeptide (TPR) repeat protein
MKALGFFRSALEHRHFVRHRTDSPWRTCADSGHSVRGFRSSGVQLRWAHRLKIYVPTRAIVCAFLVSPVFAQSDAEFAKANQDYAQGNFKDAISGYETLVRSRQWSANLFYDLGNAYFRTGDFGRAILNYERALALEPNHPEATANLQIARDEVRALEMQKSWRERYLLFASTNQYTITAAVAFWVGLFCVTGLIFARRRPAAIIALLAFSILVFVVAVLAIYELDYSSNGRALAIVTGKDVQARLATADTANSVLALPPGSEVKILSTRGDWTYAALPNNLRGWIPAKSAEQVRL